jgi:hypothetical protein
MERGQSVAQRQSGGDILFNPREEILHLDPAACFTFAQMCSTEVAAEPSDRRKVVELDAPER